MTDQERAVMQQALEALENGKRVRACEGGTKFQIPLEDNAITALRAALAQQPEPTQEPVAWMVYTEDGKSVCVTDNPNDLVGACRALPLYTTPPQRPPLTDEEIQELSQQHKFDSRMEKFVRIIERKVRGEE